MLCFSVSCFFLIALFVLRNDLHYKPVPHLSTFFLSGSTTSRPAFVREMNPPPPRKNSSRGKTRPDRGSDENEAYFLLHSPFLYPQTDTPQGGLRKRKRAGHDGKEKGYCQLLLGYPAGAEERESPLWHLSRLLRFLGEIWC